MKRTALLLIASCLLITPALGVVGHNNSDSEIGITSSSSATTAVGPNGTDYTAKVEMQGRNRVNTEDRINNETISSSKVEFNGTIRAGTPCHVLEHEVTQSEEGYILNIETAQDTERGEVCTQVVTGINYHAEFEGKSGFNLEVQHNGETIETFQTVSDKGNKNKDSGTKKTFFQKVLGFLGF